MKVCYGNLIICYYVSINWSKPFVACTTKEFHAIYVSIFSLGISKGKRMGLNTLVLLAFGTIMICFASISYAETGTATFYKRPYVREYIYITEYIYIAKPQRLIFNLFFQPLHVMDIEMMVFL